MSILILYSDTSWSQKLTADTIPAHRNITLSTGRPGHPRFHSGFCMYCLVFIIMDVDLHIVLH